MQPNDRSRLAFMIRYAMRHPARIVPHARRLARDAVLRLRNRDHVSYYRAVMRSDAARSDEGAVGSHTHESWLKIGQMQFDYLVSHGLKPGTRMLEIGCGNLRAGRLFIEYLDAGDYYGIDISPDILLAAQRTLAEAGLQHKLPHLTLVQDLKLEFLPAGYFDVVHAHSVFSHSPVEVIDECLAHVGRVMKPDGFFDFTFDRTEGAEHHVLREDFYYRTETLVALAGLARTDRTAHERLGRAPASAIQAAHLPPGQARAAAPIRPVGGRDVASPGAMGRAVAGAVPGVACPRALRRLDVSGAQCPAGVQPVARRGSWIQAVPRSASPGSLRCLRHGQEEQSDGGRSADHVDPGQGD